jgi:hypothetical protein
MMASRNHEPSRAAQPCRDDCAGVDGIGLVGWDHSSMTRSFDFTRDDAPRIASEREREREPSAEEQIIDIAMALEITQTMSHEDLTNAKTIIERASDAVMQISSNIKGQIEEANERRYRDGVYSDPNWWKRVNGAQRAKAWQRQQLQNKYGVVNRALRAFRHVTQAIPMQESRDRMFIRMAKLHLPDATYQRLWQLVDEMEQMTKDDK